MEKFYSRRENKLTPSFLSDDLNYFRKLFSATFSDFSNKGMFNEAFGYSDKNGYFNNGVITSSWNEITINNILLLYINKDHLWPINENYEYYTEEDCFDLIEYLYTIVSEPKSKYERDKYGMSYEKIIFDRESGKEKYLDYINDILFRYGDKYEFSQVGRIEIKRNEAEKQLCCEVRDESDEIHENDVLIDNAINEFVLSRGNEDKMYSAILLLHTVFESLEGIVVEGLSTDENQLFNIINNYGIRHKNKSKGDITRKDLVFPWLFYSMLATINLKLKYIHQKKKNKK